MIYFTRYLLMEIESEAAVKLLDLYPCLQSWLNGWPSWGYYPVSHIQISLDTLETEVLPYPWGIDSKP
jgi:hypothetical protein